MAADHKTKKDSEVQDRWNGQETVNWSTTEGYDAVRQVNNWLKWPSIWADRKVKTKIKLEVNPEIRSESRVKEMVKQDLKPIPVVKPENTAAKLPKPSVRIVEVKKPVAKQPSFWEKWTAKREADRLRRANKLRSRQIKQVSGGLSADSSQVSRSDFQAKEARRQQLAEVRRSVHVPATAANLSPVETRATVAKLEPAKPEAAKPAIVKSGGQLEDNNHQQRLQDLKQRFEQKSWNRPTITETNLVSSQSTLYFNWNKFWLVLIQWLVVTLFFLSLCGSLLYLWQQRQIKQAADVTQRFNKINQLIGLTENEVSDVLDFRLRLIIVSSLLNNHVYWNNFFSFLEKNTLPNVFYRDFSGDTKGDYILKARTDSFDSMAKQLKAFRRSSDVLEVSSEGGEMVKNDAAAASSTNQAIPSTQLNFSIHLKIKPDLFYR